jgi:hypothetical protein
MVPTFEIGYWSELWISELPNSFEIYKSGIKVVAGEGEGLLDIRGEKDIMLEVVLQKLRGHVSL